MIDWTIMLVLLTSGIVISTSFGSLYTLIMTGYFQDYFSLIDPRALLLVLSNDES